MNEDALKSKLQAATQSTGLTFNEGFHRQLYVPAKTAA